MHKKVVEYDELFITHKDDLKRSIKIIKKYL